MNLYSSEDKRIHTRRKTTTEAEGWVREQELLLLLGTIGMEVGRCGSRKMLYLVATGIEVGRSNAGQLLLFVVAGMEVGRHSGDRVNNANGCLERWLLSA